MSPKLAKDVAQELTNKDALKAHAEAELGISHDEHVSPGAAAISSFVAFAAGSLLPLLTATATPWLEFRIPFTVVAVILSLALTGFVAAQIGGAKPMRAILRNVLVSLLTMSVTYGIGMLVGGGLPA
jgi:VIT1/CCC1 family predicted Fe2+/Mn2+ transporter